MKFALFFLAFTALPSFGMHRAAAVSFNKNFIPYTLTNKALIKSLADRKQQLVRQNTLNLTKPTSCFVVHKKAGIFNTFDSTSWYYSGAFKEKINAMHLQKNLSCDPSGPDSILDDREYVSLRPTSHADESSKWQDYA